MFVRAVGFDRLDLGCDDLDEPVIAGCVNDGEPPRASMVNLADILFACPPKEAAS